MGLRSLAGLVIVFAVVLTNRGDVAAQSSGCPATVFYHESLGSDTGQCTSLDSACNSLKYALEQGQDLCPEQVNVFYADPNNIYQQIEWRPPPLSSKVKDAIWLVGQWIGPALGLVVGWLVGWGVMRRRPGGSR